VNLETLFNKVQESGRIKPSRLPHIRMSIRNYVGALGCPSVRDCSQEVFAIDKSERDHAIENYFAGRKSPHLLRNTKNDISYLLRQAEDLNLIELPAQMFNDATILSFGKRKLGRSLPRKILPDRTGFHRDPYGLALDKWHEHLRSQYDDWKEWVSTNKTSINGIKPYNRPATIENKTTKFEAYFGYLFNIRGIHNLDFQMLLDVSEEPLSELGDDTDFVFMRKNPRVGLLEEFTNWHRERNNDKSSFQVREVLSVAASIVQKYYFPKALLADQYEIAEKYNKVAGKISSLQKRSNESIQRDKLSFARPEQLVTAEDLRLVATKEFPHKLLFNNQSSTVSAQNAGRGLAIMLLINYPLRNINYRESRLKQNIIKNAGGEWILRFTGDDEIASLKSKDRLNKRNIYERIIEPKTASLLDTYISEWRPKLVRQIDVKIQQLKTDNHTPAEDLQILKGYKDYLFLNSRGIPFSRQGFSTWIERGTYRWLGVRINPEKIRYLSAVEMFKKGKTVFEIAEQLNDVPESISRIKSKYS